MPYVVYTADDVASSNIASALKDIMGFKETDAIDGRRRFMSGDTFMLETGGRLYEAEYLNEMLDTDLMVFLSRHASEKGLASFTAHSLGNWSDEARFGGRGKCLSVAAPEFMLKVLHGLKKNNSTGIPVTYEATHHGPLIDTPSLFVELGG
ncbi:MAG: D-aminoacyl-tRNA deacylase, partial [Candidatus Micrarchaeaceae archaeon]